MASPMLKTEKKDEEKILFELDKDLRSQQLPQQSEAILLFGELLLAQGNSSLIVNSSLLKIADVFRTRFERLCRHLIPCVAITF